MKIQYYELGPDKKLNEIVMIGSHDAGITEGMSHVKTQNLDIAKQAEAGVRIFDIRITGGVVATLGPDKKPIAQLQSFHGFGVGGPKGKVGVVENRSGQYAQMKVAPMSQLTGAYGQSLTKILTDAKSFVTTNDTEFLILKFDHCANWQMIAEACVDLLDDKIYTGGGNINVKTLRDLKGRVIVVFADEGRKLIPVTYTDKGIYGVRSLFSKDGGPKSYDPNYQGIQYMGKGGTKVGGMGLFRTFKYKMKENIKKQTKILTQGSLVSQDVLGMMYWTTTGVSASIKKRNDFLWNEDNRDKLVDLWESRIPANVDPSLHSASGALKRFMPNFVMVDFADAERCAKIYELNAVNPLDMQKVFATG